MKAKKQITSLAKILPFGILRKIAPKVPLNVFYHIVSNKYVPYVSAYHVKTESEFIADIDFILSKYEPVDMETIVSGKAKPNSIHLSFDDGLRECSEIIAPILLQKGIPATFFVNSEFVGNHDFFKNYRESYSKDILAKTGKVLSLAEINDALSDIRPYMNEKEIVKLANNGFTIGGHSVTHPEFWHLSLDEQFFEVKENMDWIREKFNPKLKVFAFPFTDDGVKAELFKKLYGEHIVDFTFGTAGYKPDQEKQHFQRIPMERKTNETAANILKSEYLYGTIRKLFGANIVLRN